MVSLQYLLSFLGTNKHSSLMRLGALFDVRPTWGLWVTYLRTLCSCAWQIKWQVEYFTDYCFKVTYVALKDHLMQEIMHNGSTRTFFELWHGRINTATGQQSNCQRLRRQHFDSWDFESLLACFWLGHGGWFTANLVHNGVTVSDLSAFQVCSYSNFESFALFFSMNWLINA